MFKRRYEIIKIGLRLKACHPMLDLKLLLAYIQSQENEMHKPGFFIYYFYIFTRLEKHGKTKIQFDDSSETFCLSRSSCKWTCSFNCKFCSTFDHAAQELSERRGTLFFISSYLICFDLMLGRKSRQQQGSTNWASGHPVTILLNIIFKPYCVFLVWFMS